MQSNDQISLAIERKRMEMYRASNMFGMSSEIVLKKSRELDALLNYRVAIKNYNKTLRAGENLH